MNRELLLRLHQSAQLSISEIKEKDSELYGAARLTIEGRLRASVRDLLRGCSDLLISAVEKVLVDPRPSHTREPVLDSLRASCGGDIVREAESVVGELKKLDEIARHMGPDQQISNHPALRREIERAKLHRLGEMAGVPDARVQQIVERAGTLAGINDELLDEMVRSRELSEDDARAIGTTVGVYTLVDDDAALADVARRQLRDVRDVALLDAPAWRTAMERARTTPPAGRTLDDYAELLTVRAAALFPSHALIGALAGETARTELAAAIANPGGEQDRAVKRYAGLGIDALMADPARSTADKTREAERRVALLRRVDELNPDLELTTLDFARDGADRARLKLDGISADDQQLVVSALKAQQRAYALAGDAAGARSLLESGYSSASAVIADGYPSFQRKTALPEAKAKRVWDEALSTVADVSSRIGTIIDAVKGGFSDVGVGNVDAGVDGYLQQIDGFEQLFGNQSACRCEHCRSLLSPAAYFVDCMCFVHEHVTKPYFSTKADHPLKLQNRRPDLWTLELTCKNSNELIPTLEIVNEVLESYIARRRDNTVSVTDRTAVENVVYRDALATLVDSFRQPFSLPLARLEAYLGHFGESRATVVDALDGSEAQRVMARLGLSRREYDVIVGGDTTLAFHRHLYRIDLQTSGTELAAFDAHLLLAPVGVTREELGTLFATRFVRLGSSTVELRMEKRDADSVQNDIERVHHLTLDALDRLHRFVRVWRHIGWSIGELDLALEQLGATALGPDVLEGLVGILELRDRLGLTVDELCALFSDVPRSATVDNGVALFDRLFNLPFYVSTEGAFPKPSTRFIHPSFRLSSTPDTTTLARLIGALRVSDEDFQRLIAALATPLGVNLTSATESDRGFLLDMTNLSMLYRHARLAQSLKVTVPQLFQLLALAGVAEKVSSRADLQRVLELDAWRRKTGWSLDDLGKISGGPILKPAAYADGATVAAAIVEEVKRDKALVFADTLFAFEGVTEEQSRAILSENSSLIVRAPDGEGFWLADAFVPSSTVSIPAGVPISAAHAREVLLRYHASRIVPPRVAAKLSIAATPAAELTAMTGTDVGSVAFTRLLKESDPPTALAALIDALVPLTILFRNAVFDEASLAFVRAHAARFGIGDFAAISLDAVRMLQVYVDFTDATSSTFTGSAAPLDAADVRAVLAAFDAARPAGERFDGTDGATLARVLRAERGLVDTVRVPLPVDAPAALAKLGRCVALAQRLGVSGEALPLIAGETYADLARAADAVLGGFRSKYTDEQEWQRKLESLDDGIRERKRDALVDHIIASVRAELATPNDLFHYFLLDVQVEGCHRTSRVVSATSSVQLYMQRVVMNLENDGRPESDPQHVHVRPNALPAGELAWRKNYRMWEGNRTIFLNPENYVEPGLRDDKTPLFRELEETLLAKEINDQHVLDAYAAYVRGFEEVARLKLAGAYHDIRDGADILHLFGVAPGDPPLYYYRTAENLIHGKGDPVWSPWKKIDVQIAAMRVGPVVHKGRLHLFWATYKTRPLNEFNNGSSRFAGYRHHMTMRFTTLQPDGTWTPPQEVKLPGEDDLWPFGPSAGQIEDKLKSNSNVPRLDTRPHPDARDDYTLSGDVWDGVYLDPSDPELGRYLSVTARNYQLYGGIDLYRRTVAYTYTQRDRPGDELEFPVLSTRDTTQQVNGVNYRPLYFGYPVYWYPNRNAYGDLVLDERRIAKLNSEYNTEPLRDGLYQTQMASVRADADLLSIAGNIEDAIVQLDGDAVLVQGSGQPGTRYTIRRIGTTLSDTFGEKLFLDGVDALLDTAYQRGLKEGPLPLAVESAGNIDQSRIKLDKLDYTGPYGVYFREIFFHIPFLIADYLNGQGKFAAAQRWYHYIFNPTADEQTTPPIDRVWRYAEFRGLDAPKLKEILTDEQQIAAYKNDPFNPHAIARLRLSAYQKSVVMKYIDNLLDWGDSLFAQFTMESVNEATLLYVLAQDILGERPIELGECGLSDEATTFAKLQGSCAQGSDFATEVESWIIGKQPRKKWEILGRKYGIDRSATRMKLKRIAPPSKAMSIARSAEIAVNARPASALALGGLEEKPVSEGLFRGMSFKETRIGGWRTEDAGAAAKADVSKVIEHKRALLDDKLRLPSFGWSIVRQVSLQFCVPANKELRGYWDRVEDRLFKIRNCMDITGARRQLALFAPEIDPRLLVRMKAAGLSLEDVLSVTSGDLPPYRFGYLIERAKQYAAVLQGYGAALLSALEKRDGEELARLRIVHSQHLQKLTTRVREWELEIAEKTIEALERQREAAQYRLDYYQQLIDTPRNGWETSQSNARHTATGFSIAGSIADIVGGIAYLVPQLGAPTAMKYGGKEIGDSATNFGRVFKGMASIAESLSGSFGLEAGFDRRKEGWQHQRELAGHDVRQIDKQLEAARIRREMAVRAIEIHERAVEQTEEIFEIYSDKFTNLALYTYLSTRLQRMFREAYQAAYALARLAEQSYRFERGDDATPLLEASYWTGAGLLCGEALMRDLHDMERRFIETNYRTLEVDQSFSLTQLDPAALSQLRETGTCRFKLPEIFFDLFYPGQYRRRIKSVRLTIPCITGPYTNVSATLRLLTSWIRKEPKLGASFLVEVPPRRSVAVATSTAQNDAGVFEVTFRDERYMPFEGLGAVSEWELSLPKSFRPFDYHTINDGIVTISYSAEEDGVLRDQVEKTVNAVEGSIVHTLQNQPLGRLFSLRQDFSQAFHRLLHSPASTDVPIEIAEKHFPMFLRGRTLTVDRALLAMRAPAMSALGGFALAIDGASQSGFTSEDDLGGLWAKDVTSHFAGGLLGARTLAVANAGNLSPTSPPPGDPSALDAAKLNDVYLYIEYRVS